MTDMLNHSSYFGVVLSLGAYILAWYLKKRTNRAIFNPILISIALVIGVLLLTGIEYQTYYASAKMLSYLLTPATVCLAIPLYEQLHLLRRNLWAILLGIAAGAIASIGSVAVLALICGLNHAEFVTLMPKSVSTAISMPLSEMLGGNAAITAIGDRGNSDRRCREPCRFRLFEADSRDRSRGERRRHRHFIARRGHQPCAGAGRNRRRNEQPFHRSCRHNHSSSSFDHRVGGQGRQCRLPASAAL